MGNEIWRLSTWVWMLGIAPSLTCWAAGAEAPATNLPPMLVAVLPFNNAAGDPSLEHWRHGFADLLEGRLAWAQKAKLIGGSQIRGPLTNAGWSLSREIDPKLAERVARELDSDAIIWGQFSRPGGEWALQVQIYRRATRQQPGVVKVSSNQCSVTTLKEASLNELLIRAPLEVAEMLGLKVPADVPAKWRQRGTSSNAIWDEFAQLLTLERTNAATTARGKLVRQILAEEPQFAPARVILAQLLAETEKNAEAEEELRKAIAQAPDWCQPRLMLAWLSLHAEKTTLAEQQLNETFRVHPGCPGACYGFYRMLHDTERWKELRQILETANAEMPDQTSTLAFLAAARVRCGDVEGGRTLLRELGNTDREDLVVHEAILEADAGSGLLGKISDEIRSLRKLAESDTNAVDVLASVDAGFFLKTGKPVREAIVRPRSYTPDQLRAEMQKRLTPEERALVVNPVEITPDIIALSKELVGGFTNPVLRAVVLFGDVTRRGRGEGVGGIRTAQQTLQSSPNSDRFSCQEFAKLFVALARAAGLEAWLVHIDLDDEGRAAYHDCAALFLGDRGFLVDPTWDAFMVEHKQFRVLNDLEAIAHQAMQDSDRPEVTRVRMGRKLDPDDPWTRVGFAHGLAKAGLPQEAEAELTRMGTNYLARWDFHWASAEVAASRELWQSALSALQRALALSPSNALVYLRLAHVYGSLGDFSKAREYAETAFRLDPGNSLALRSAERRSEFEMIGALEQSHNPKNRGALLRRAEAGEAPAQYALAKMFFESRPPDFDHGMEWLRKAAEQGDDEVQQNYARNLVGLRGAAGAQEALLWYTRSATQGNREAQFHLGILLYEGKFVPRDELTACQWALLAAANGHAEARDLVREMELFLDKSKLAEARRRAAEFKPRRAQSEASR